MQADGLPRRLVLGKDDTGAGRDVFTVDDPIADAHEVMAKRQDHVVPDPDQDEAETQRQGVSKRHQQPEDHGEADGDQGKKRDTDDDEHCLEGTVKMENEKRLDGQSPGLISPLAFRRFRFT